MKKIQLLSLAFYSVLCSYSYAQNLQFNSAVFYEYSGGVSNSNTTVNTVTTGTITVAANQVLKITQVGGSLGAPNFSYGCLQAGLVLINDKVVGFRSEKPSVTEIYLPTGTYSVGFTDSYAYDPTYACPGEVLGFISGVLYDIVP